MIGANDTGANDERWLVRCGAGSQPETTLFCFPYAGGGTIGYRKWARLLPAHIEVCAVRLPGRESRFGEPPFTSLPRLIDVLAPILAPRTARPYALFGHSMGALLAFEMARALRRLGAPAPRRLIVSGRRAPQLGLRANEKIHELSDAALREHLRRLEGTPPEILDSDELMELVLPSIRADYRMIETYQHGAEPPLACPLSVFVGTEDPYTSHEHEIEGWREHTRDSFDVTRFSGGHFFIDQETARVTEAIARTLQGRDSA